MEKIINRRTILLGGLGLAASACGIGQSPEKTATPTATPNAEATKLAQELADLKKELTALKATATPTPVRPEQSTATAIIVKPATAPKPIETPRATAAVIPTATEAPKATATSLPQPEVHFWGVDEEIQAGKTGIVTTEMFQGGKIAINKGDSVVTFKNGNEVIQRVVTYDNHPQTGQMTLIISDVNVEVYSPWGSNLTKQLEPINTLSFVEHNIALMEELGCENGCSKGVMITVTECKGGKVTVSRITKDQLKAWVEARIAKQ